VALEQQADIDPGQVFPKEDFLFTGPILKDMLGIQRDRFFKISARPAPIGKPLLRIKYTHPRIFVLHGKFYCGFLRKQTLISTKFSPSRRRKKK
jgi:hypothetical protein